MKKLSTVLQTVTRSTRISSMKTIITLLTLSLLSSSAFARRGEGSSGGGQGIVFKSGEVKLLDLIDYSDLPGERLATDQDIKKTFYKKNRYVKSPVSKVNGFFDCSSKILKDNENPIINWLSQSVKNLKVYLTDSRFVAIDEKVLLENAPSISLPFFSTASPSYPINVQTPLATYSNQRLWISKRFYEKLSQEDSCALALHESFRFLNHAFALENLLTTKEIEQLVRFFFKHSYSEEIINDAFNKLVLIKKDKIAPRYDRSIENEQAINNELIHIYETTPDYPIGSEMRNYLEQRSGDLEILLLQFTQVDMNKFSVSMHGISGVVNNLEGKIIKLQSTLNERNDEEVKEEIKSMKEDIVGLLYNNQQDILKDKSFKTYNSVPLKRLKNLNVQMHIDESLAMKKLPAFKYYDTYEDIIKTRIIP